MHGKNSYKGGKKQLQTAIDLRFLKNLQVQNQAEVPGRQKMAWRSAVSPGENAVLNSTKLAFNRLLPIIHGHCRSVFPIPTHNRIHEAMRPRGSASFEPVQVVVQELVQIFVRAIKIIRSGRWPSSRGFFGCRVRTQSLGILLEYPRRSALRT